MAPVVLLSLATHHTVLSVARAQPAGNCTVIDVVVVCEHPFCVTVKVTFWLPEFVQVTDGLGSVLEAGVPLLNTQL